MSSNIRSDGRGSRSDGLRMNVLPQAIANGRNHSGIIAGKLNGVIAPTTPTGWRTSSTSTPPRDALEVLALEQVRDRAVAASVDSIPRSTSPRASPSVLPMSSVTRRAISSWCSQSASRSAITARARFCGGTARQAGCASRAARAAASTSAAPESGTSAASSPVAGLRSSSVPSPAASTQPPPM